MGYFCLTRMCFVYNFGRNLQALQIFRYFVAALNVGYNCAECLTSVLREMEAALRLVFL
jgi:hypothetical protein